MKINYKLEDKLLLSVLFFYSKSNISLLFISSSISFYFLFELAQQPITDYKIYY